MSAADESGKAPGRIVTNDDLTESFHLLRSDPEKYLELAGEVVRQNPENSSAYFSRHQALKTLGRIDEALADLDRAEELSPHAIHHKARGLLLRELNRYREAIAAFDMAETMDA